jgi:hypothetical protein
MERFVLWFTARFDLKTSSQIDCKCELNHIHTRTSRPLHPAHVQKFFDDRLRQYDARARRAEHAHAFN